MNILKSASRIGMLFSILVLWLSFIYVVLKNANTESVVMWVLTVFTNVITGITTYYYTKKQTDAGVDTNILP